MKKIYMLCLSTLLTTLIYAQNPVPNPSFEAWSGGNPTGWDNSNNVTQSTDARTGTYAAQGLYTTGGFTPSLSVGMGNGFTTTTRWAYFNFYYKFVNTGNAHLTVSVYFDDANYTIGSGTQTIYDATNTYTLVSVPVHYNLSGNPIDCTLGINLTNGSTGCYFLVDDVSLTSTPLAVNEISPAIGFTITPNPSNSYLSIALDQLGSRTYNLQLYDLSGREIKSVELTSIHTNLDVSEIPQGIYFVTIKSDELLETKKIVISR